MVISSIIPDASLAASGLVPALNGVVEGTIDVWHQDKGYGFVQPARGGRRVFCHAHSIQNGGDRAGRLALKEGTKVSFALQFDEDRNKFKAVNVNVLDESGIVYIGGSDARSTNANAPVSQQQLQADGPDGTNGNSTAPDPQSSVIQQQRSDVHPADPSKDVSLLEMAKLKKIQMVVSPGVGCSCDRCKNNESWRHEIIAAYAKDTGREVEQKKQWETADVIWKVRPLHNNFCGPMSARCVP